MSRESQLAASRRYAKKKRAELKSAGLKYVEVWIKPQHEQQLKDFVQKLNEE